MGSRPPTEGDMMKPEIGQLAPEPPTPSCCMPKLWPISWARIVPLTAVEKVIWLTEVAPSLASELEFFLFEGSYTDAREAGHRGLRTTQGYVEDYHLLSGTMVESVIGAIRRDVDASGVPV